MEPIYCPKCGVQAASKQKFCRACGQDLLAVAALLKAQPAIDVWKRWPMVWGVTLLIAGTAIASVLKVLSNQGIKVAGEMTPYLLALAVLVVFSAFGLLTYAVFSANSQHRQLTPPATGEATTNRMQPALAEAAPTITERTTELMERDGVSPVERITAPQTIEASERQ